MSESVFSTERRCIEWSRWASPAVAETDLAVTAALARWLGAEL